MNRLARALAPGLLLVSMYYALFGGEYSIFEVRRSRAALAEERLVMVDLAAQIDSLSGWAESLRTDPHTLERVARERFGMIMDGETLYRFANPEEADSGLPEEDTGN